MSTPPGSAHAADALSLRVREVSRATCRSVLVRLDLGEAPFTYRAGQAATLGRHGQPVRRPYSIASAPADARSEGALEFLIGLDEAGRLGPHLAPLAPGTLVDVGGASGTFVLPEPVRGPMLFIGGGTGFAPLRAMLRETLRQYPEARPALALSVRTLSDLPFAQETEAASGAGRIHFLVTLTREAPEGWTGARGRLTAAHLAPMVDAGRTLCAVCGPPGFVAHVAGLLASLGVGESRMLRERW